MKRIVFILFIISIICLSTKERSFVIPDNAIRFRIIANSNSLKDQTQKSIIKEKINLQIVKQLNNINSYKDAEDMINNNVTNIENIVKKYADNYNINYGYNYFPEKEYRGVKYPEGNYKSLVITLGEGLGDNWWCVLYPPLCLIDEENIKENEYAFYIKEIFTNYTN